MPRQSSSIIDQTISTSPHNRTQSPAKSKQLSDIPVNKSIPQKSIDFDIPAPDEPIDMNSESTALVKAIRQSGQRRIVGQQESLNEPFCYVGRLEVSGAGYGTATLIGSRHILTAAHVVVNAPAAGWTFTLPDGRTSGVSKLTWNEKAFLGPAVRAGSDLAICVLVDELGKNGRHAKWRFANPDQDFGNPAFVCGYDGDFKRKLGRYILVCRSAVLQPTGYRQSDVLYPVAGSVLGLMADGLAMSWGRKPSLRGTLFGLVSGAAYPASREMIASGSWTMPGTEAAPGASGSPLWVLTSHGPEIIGVQSQIDSNPFSSSRDIPVAEPRGALLKPDNLSFMELDR